MTAPLLAAALTFIGYAPADTLDIRTEAAYAATFEPQADSSVVSFTLPWAQARGCGAGPDSLRDSLQWRVSVRVQSPAWIAMRPAMLADAGVWAALWPIVRAEAEPRTVASGTAAPGSRASASVPDTLTAPHWYSATSRNGRGESCTSNVIDAK